MFNQLISLLRVFRFADLALPPTCPPGTNQVYINTGGGIEGGYYTCVSNKPEAISILTVSFIVTTFWYYLATLAFEIPILYWLGFRSKRAIIWAFIANFITVFCFHYASTYFSNQAIVYPSRRTVSLTQGTHIGFIVAEIIVTIVEALIYILALRKELPIPKIIQASILANAFSAIIGGLIVNTLFGGFVSSR